MANGVYDEKLCDERHEGITKLIDKLFNRLNWFYVITIVTLIATVANLIK